MTLSTTFWRRISYLLALALVVTAWNLAVRAGYPQQWDRVRYGMHASEVWSLCGTPTISSGGMKADHWEQPFLLGHWEFYVNCGDMIGGQPGVVTDIRLYYEQFPFSKIWVKSQSPKILDYEAYKQAFGVHANASSAEDSR